VKMFLKTFFMALNYLVYLLKILPTLKRYIRKDLFPE
jgi:hypothetical protein